MTPQVPAPARPGFVISVLVCVQRSLALVPYRSQRIRVQSRKLLWQSIIRKSALWKLRAVNKDMVWVTLTEQPLLYTDINY